MDDLIRLSTLDEWERLRRMRKLAEEREGDRTGLTVTAFFGHGPTGQMGSWVFSQWAETPFRHAGVRYRTAEHWMMACKAHLFGDEPREKAILEASTPKEAKALGRLVQGFDDMLWRSHRYQIVCAGTALKFTQNPAAERHLLSTRGLLIEASPYDRIWGVGLPLGHPDLAYPTRWPGLNLLGFALTTYRHELQRRERTDRFEQNRR